MMARLITYVRMNLVQKYTYLSLQAFIYKLLDLFFDRFNAIDQFFLSLTQFLKLVVEFDHSFLEITL